MLRIFIERNVKDLGAVLKLNTNYENQTLHTY